MTAKVTGVTRPPVPAALRWAIALVAVETVAIWVFAGVLVAGRAPRLAGYFAIYAVTAAFLLWGLVKRRPWSRAPIVVVQLLMIAAGAQGIRSGAWPLGVALIVVAVACVLLILSRPAREALGVR